MHLLSGLITDFNAQETACSNPCEIIGEEAAYGDLENFLLYERISLRLQTILNYFTF